MVGRGPDVHAIGLGRRLSRRHARRLRRPRPPRPTQPGHAGGVRNRRALPHVPCVGASAGRPGDGPPERLADSDRRLVLRRRHRAVLRQPLRARAERRDDPGRGDAARRRRVPRRLGLSRLRVDLTAMRPRRTAAFALSLMLHLTALGAAIRSSSPSMFPAPAAAPRSMTVFAAPREDDSGPPGLNALGADDLPVRRLPESASVSLPSFAMNIAKISERSALLFPFVTPGLALRRFAIATERERRE